MRVQGEKPRFPFCRADPRGWRCCHEPSSYRARETGVHEMTSVWAARPGRGPSSACLQYAVHQCV